MVVDAASHGIIDPGSKADIRPAYQPPLPSPRRPLPMSLCVVPWSLPLEDYGVGTSLSSPIELDTEPRRGVCRTLIRLLLSHIPRHCRLSCTSVYSTLALPPRSSSARTFETPSKPHVHQTAAFSTCPRSPYTYIPSFFLFPSFFILVYFTRNIDLSWSVLC